MQCVHRRVLLVLIATIDRLRMTHPRVTGSSDSGMRIPLITANARILIIEVDAMAERLAEGHNHGALRRSFTDEGILVQVRGGCSRGRGRWGRFALGLWLQRRAEQ